MEWLIRINYFISIVFLICYSYQYVFIPVSLFFRKKEEDSAEMHNHYAVLICARNEERVIEDILHSILAQTYPHYLIDVFVMADNCTDATAEIAKRNGARVYERFNRKLVGKGYALQVLLRNIHRDYPDTYDGYFIFDADNILSRDYIEKMNVKIMEGNDIVTGYRNSKNYGSNWISAGYALWFLRECRFLSEARSILGLSCAVGGTGFYFSEKIAREMGDWPYHLLTEDIEFSVDQILKGRKIAYCKEAELYDEQPITFIQSYKQRLRWSKGYLQIFEKYGLKLVKGVFQGNLSCLDMALSIMPAFILSNLALAANLWFLLIGLGMGKEVSEAGRTLGELFSNAYVMLLLVGTVTLCSEWKHIHAPVLKKICSAFTFPLFMFTYLPISTVSLFSETRWEPIEHKITASVLQEEKKRAFF